MPSLYQLRVVLRAVSPLIWRRLLVGSETSIATLHSILQTTMGWSDLHLHRFRVHGKAYGIARCGGISFADDPFETRLSDFQLRRGERFFYEYDFTDGWVLDIRLEKIHPFDEKGAYPCCSAGRRTAPSEDCGGPWAYLSTLDGYDLRRWEAYERLVEAVGRLVATGDRHPQGDDELCEAVDELQAVMRFRPSRFDRRAVNAQLRGMAAEIGGAG